MSGEGVVPLVIPNGLTADAFDPPDRPALAELRRRFRGRTLLAKMARWDPDKRWIAAVEIVAEMKRQSWRPLLIARGGSEPHGEEVIAAVRSRGLEVTERTWREPGVPGLMKALQEVGTADVVLLRSHVDPEVANSEHEPFGLVGLETMAAGGIACTGCSGEDYAIAGQNALVLETADPREFVGLFKRLRSNPAEASALRRSGRSTAQRYAWPQVARGVLLPRIELARAGAGLMRRAAPQRTGQPPGLRSTQHHLPTMRTPIGLSTVIDSIVT
jgi:glycosyltransferase involved in cell wall biosynthesis